MPIFIISDINPIIGPTSGKTITITGNKLNEITGIKSDSVDCQILTNDENLCVHPIFWLIQRGKEIL
jgi:hypothetical protein